MAVFKIISGSNADEFIQYLNRVEHGFVYMIETMRDVARLVGENTQPITPIETGRLGRSYKWTVVTDNSRMKVLQVQMSALNSETGYDYAWIQHENFMYNHHKPLGSREAEYKRWDAHGYSHISVTYGYHQGQAWYLRDGIRNSQDDAMILIEEDYLSLFQRGFIY